MNTKPTYYLNAKSAEHANAFYTRLVELGIVKSSNGGKMTYDSQYKYPLINIYNGRYHQDAGKESYIKTGNCTEITLTDLYDEEFLKKLEVGENTLSIGVHTLTYDNGEFRYTNGKEVIDQAMVAELVALADYGKSITIGCTTFTLDELLKIRKWHDKVKGFVTK